MSIKDSIVKVSAQWIRQRKLSVNTHAATHAGNLSRKVAVVQDSCWEGTEVFVGYQIYM